MYSFIYYYLVLLLTAMFKATDSTCATMVIDTVPNTPKASVCALICLRTDECIGVVFFHYNSLCDLVSEFSVDSCAANGGRSWIKTT